MPEPDLSSLGQLSSSNDEPFVTGLDNSRRDLPAWVLPMALLLGFLVIFALLFGRRLLPATKVKVQPAITLRSEAPVELLAGSESVSISSKSVANDLGGLLFQASGWIEPDPFPITVSTLVSGIVDEVYVLEGDKISKDQKLSKLIDQDAKYDVQERQARAQTLRDEINANKSRIPVIESRRQGSQSGVNSQRIRLAELQDRLNRLQSLPEGSIPAVELAAARLQADQQKSLLNQASSQIPGIDSEIEMVRSEIAAKRSALREAEIAIARSQLALDRHLVRSPIDGVVLRLHAAPGTKRIIRMDDPKSASIVELFNPEKLQARIDVPLSEAADVSVGQPVDMICDLLPNLTLKGEVTRITGQADLQRNTLQVKVRVNNPDSRLRPEMLVRGKFYAIPKAQQESDASATSRRLTTGRLSIYIPIAALFNDNQVWVVGNNSRAELRTVTLAKDTRDGHQLAAEGVRSGALIILPPHNKLKNGTRIKIKP